ncbi:TDP-N-acetylfucosamine:lipid II N-acetylfucosaminyltransferase [Chitinophaga sp. GCM10012297]|uniref:TDP-N-acetylfucosamine:lipid II N-acetylfucosaminyltransferase n=1 Tax=Chitinophaga chungangae TaxID=2821488 RepID=A0ABS3YEZ1_9BACT|nr:TDP-N-acetylfucosamine:lipid II N-acetylfucosaminyltransferase [Chitinophaga chungangae]MBO9153261.1 TDP-N-acetylfucosamine:lipid II N-acetylfucosaminyltransferase [Chitinophaga chungangae]
MKYVHVIVNTAYTAPFISFVNTHFKAEEHFFYVIGGWSEETVRVPVSGNVRSLYHTRHLLNGFRMLKDMNVSKKIFIHGLFSPYILWALVTQPWLLKKCSWAVWGGDLYHYQVPRETLRLKVEEWLRRICIKRFGELITIKGDYELAQKWYGVKGVYKYAMYSTPLKIAEIDQIIRSGQPKVDTGVISIQIGNSAAYENNHFEIIDLLKQYRDQNIKIYALLSYGENDYAEKVIAYGRSVFEDKFVPVRNYMEFKDFVLFMNSMDLIVFNHKRQQALGNLLLATYLQKKVFISSESSLWGLFTDEFGMMMEDTQSIRDLDYERFKTKNQAGVERNKIKADVILDEKFIIGLWDALFDK